MTSSEKQHSSLLMFYTPKGVVVSRSDERHRRTGYDCIPHWVFSDVWRPIGRLDRDSRGLRLFTHDGQLFEFLTRSRTISKTYDVWLRGRLTAEHLAQLKCGISSRRETLAPQEIIVCVPPVPKAISECRSTKAKIDICAASWLPSMTHSMGDHSRSRTGNASPSAPSSSIFHPGPGAGSRPTRQSHSVPPPNSTPGQHRATRALLGPSGYNGQKELPLSERRTDLLQS